MAESFQDHMKATGAKPGYYVANWYGGNGHQARRQRVLDHSSNLFSQGFRWTSPTEAELWMGGVVRVFRFKSERGEDMRAFVGTYKHGRTIEQFDGYASDLDHAQRIMVDELKAVGAHNIQFYGVQWKSKVDW
jgi:hypothetical protein